MLEKFGYVITVAVLNSKALISATEARAALPDLMLGILFIAFIAAFVKTRTSSQPAATVPGSEQ